MARTIVIFSALYAPSMGGVELYTASLARELAREGCRSVVVTSDLADSGAYEKVDGVEIWRLPCKSLAGGRLPLVMPNREYRAIMRRLEDLRPSGVVVQTRFYPLSLEGLSYARRLGIRPVVIDHGSDYLGFGDKRIDWLVRSYERAITAAGRLGAADYYGVSQMSATWLETFGIQARGTISNAVDAEGFRSCSSGRDFHAELEIGRDTLVVAFTGRLVPDKGTDVLVKVSRLLAERGIDARILVAGDGPEFETMRQADVPGLHLLGRLDRSDVAALLKASDVFLFPSSYPEGMPTSLLEASACGVPSIATDVGGVREIIPNEGFGWVLDEPDSDACATQIAWCAEHRSETASMGFRCRRRVEQVFSWERTAASVLAACDAAELRGVR